MHIYLLMYYINLLYIYLVWCLITFAFIIELLAHYVNLDMFNGI